MTSIRSDAPPTRDLIRLANGLGWFSLGLGVPQVLAPGLVNRVAGIHDDRRSRAVQRLVGVRELSGAAGLLGMGVRRPTLWARVAGDLIDLTLLGLAWSSRRDGTARLALATGSVAVILGLDAVGATQMDDEHGGRSRSSRTVSVTLDVGQDEVSSAWQRIAADDDVMRAATFRPAPGGTGTEVHVRVTADNPLVDAVKTAAGTAPHQQVHDALRRFKQLVEAGEIAKSDAVPEGESHEHMYPRQRPAQPVEHVSA